MQVWSAETINAVEGHTDIAGTGEVMEGSTVSKNPGVRLFFVGGPERSMGRPRAAWQELLDASEAG